jgi:putative membrane protein
MGSRRAARHRQPPKRVPLILLAVILVLGIALGIAPWERSDWLLENVPAVLGIGILVLTWRRFPLSTISYSLIFAFLVLHEVGAHYTYSKVPYDEWFEALTGRGLNDLFGFRAQTTTIGFVHYSYGLLLAYPMRELFVRGGRREGFLGLRAAVRPHHVQLDGVRAHRVDAALIVGSNLGTPTSAARATSGTRRRT